MKHEFTGDVTKLRSGYEIYKDRDLSCESSDTTLGGELADIAKGVLFATDGMTYDYDKEVDCQIITGPYKGHWVCISSHLVNLLSPLAQLARAAE